MDLRVLALSLPPREKVSSLLVCVSVGPLFEEGLAIAPAIKMISDSIPIRTLSP